MSCCVKLSCRCYFVCVRGVCFIDVPVISSCVVWSSGQSSWLQIQRSGFDSQRYKIFWEVVGLEWGSLSLVSTIEELFGRKSSGSGLERRGYGSRDQSRWLRGTLYPQNLAVTSGGRSVGMVRSQTQATEFVVCSGVYVLLLMLQQQIMEVQES
jgi:hypothetical protein